MKIIGLSYRDYYQLICGIDPDSPIANEPCNTERAAGMLRSRGYAATSNKLQYLVRKEIVPEVGQNGREAAWTSERIDLAAGYFERQAEFTEEAGFYASKGLTMTEVYQALWNAFKAVWDQYGEAAGKVFATTPNIDYFTMTITPEWDQRPAKVSFDLLPEVRREIEQAAKAKARR